VASVRGYRVRHGIPSRTTQFRWTDEAVSRLGQEPDADIAESLGIDVVKVASKRQYLKIPAYREASNVLKDDLTMPLGFANVNPGEPDSGYRTRQISHTSIYTMPTRLLRCLPRRANAFHPYRRYAGVGYLALTRAGS
ncbi:MAG: hypothetical protein ACF8CQ_19865, partial [Rhodopirellula sp. JB044]